MYVYNYTHIVCVYVCVCVIPVQVRKQFSGVDSLLPPCGFWVLNSGCKALVVSVLIEPFHCSRLNYFKILKLH